jgi:hypothetical protein
MNKMEKTLKQRYEELAEEYRETLVKKFYPDEVPFADSCWVADEIGGILDLHQDFYDYDTIRYIVDNDVQYETWEDWYQYCQEVGDFGIKTPTIKAWCKGCPRLSDEQVERLVKLKQDLQDQIEEDKQYLKGGF